MSDEHSTSAHHGKHRPKLTQGTTQKPSREPSDNLLSYYESPLANEGKNYARPASPAAKPPSTRILRKMSTTSTSSSDYSYDSEATDPSGKATGSEASSVTRRSRTPSQGGADRRRVAIVQMETLNEATSSGKGSASSIRSRRGYESNLSGLALVAPPDAAPRSYTQLTPPSTAPISGKHFLYYERDRLDKGHQRSTSEVVLPKKKTSPRDVGIVGTARNAVISESRSSTENKNRKDKKDKENNNNHTLQPPIFQRPSKSRSPSPIPNAISEKLEDEANMLSPVSAYYKTMNPRPIIPPIVTPEIGEGKEIHVPVAAPVVVSLQSTVQIKNSPVLPCGTDTPNALDTSRSVPIPESPSFLHYQPGVHATAGPLPPPPRAAFSIDARSPPPPRPPRLHSPNPPRTRGDIEVVKQALQLPTSVSAVLSSKLPEIQPLKIHKDVKGDSSHSASSRDSHVSMAQSIHSWEGAFPLSIVNEESRTSTPSVHSPPILDQVAKVEEEVIDQPPEPETSDVHSVTIDDIPSVIIDEVPAPPATDSGHSWIDVERELSPSPEGNSAASADHSRSSSSPNGSHSHSISHEAPSPPPKSFRNNLTTNLKRFSSLPRTPSLSSRSNRRTSSGTNYSSRTPSPSIHHVVKPHRPKIRSRDPAALFCHEVFSQRTPMERCVIYATKINELYLHDCGLSDWVAEMKDRGPNGQRASSQQQLTSQPRQTSRSSVISEMTFPRRSDASAATDLSHGAYHDITPSHLPPTLPYPSLAVHPPRSSPSRSNSTVGSGTAPSSIRSLASSNSTSKTAGFFASLGRKTSISSAKRERLGPPASTTGSGKLLAKNPSTISRPIYTNNNSPTVPGGPRAPPNRAQRSQTLMTTTSSHSPSPVERNDALGRRPSLFNLPSDSVIDIQADPDFVLQVDKLSDLLPHADRDVLARYLRRAGQDILAIGQYLEDEKNGAIRTD